MLINPINGQKYGIHSANGRNLLKYYINHYNKGGMKRKREDYEDDSEPELCTICFGNLGEHCEICQKRISNQEVSFFTDKKILLGCPGPNKLKEVETKKSKLMRSACICDIQLNCGHKFHFCCFESYFTTIQETDERFGSLPSYWNGIDLATPTCPLCRTHIVSVFTMNSIPLAKYSEPWHSRKNWLFAEKIGWPLGITDGFSVIYEGDVPTFHYRGVDELNKWEKGVGLLSKRFKALVNKMVQKQIEFYEEGYDTKLRLPEVRDYDDVRTGVPEMLPLIYKIKLRKLNDTEQNNRTSEIYNNILYYILFMSDHDYDQLNSMIDELSSDRIISSQYGGYLSEAPIYMNTIGPHAAKVYPNEYSYNSSRIVDGSTSAIIRQLSNIYNKPGTPESARWLPVPVNKYAALGSLILISILTDFCHISVVKRLIDLANTIDGFKNIIIDNSFNRLSPLNGAFSGLLTAQGGLRPYFNNKNPIIDIIIHKFYLLNKSLPEVSAIQKDRHEYSLDTETDIGANTLADFINILRNQMNDKLFTSPGTIRLPFVDYVDNTKREEYMGRLVHILEYIINILRRDYNEYYNILLETPIADSYIHGPNLESRTLGQFIEEAGFSPPPSGTVGASTAAPPPPPPPSDG